MNHPLPPARIECDLLVIGSGAGGLTTAVTARKHGLDVVVIEKEDVFGGTTAFSGGVLWIPGNALARQAGIADSRPAAIEYIRNETGPFYDAQAVEAFLDAGPEMVDFLEREGAMKFVPALYPDYHPSVPGGVDIGRSILAAPFDLRELGAERARMRPPLQTITFIGMMFNSSSPDLKHFFNVTRSLTSFTYVARRLAAHLKELALYRRGVSVTSGNALAARLAKACFDLGIPIYTATGARTLVRDGGTITGALATGPQGSEIRIDARRGVVLACGGFSHDLARITQAYPHLRRGGEHLSPVPAGNTGDGLHLAEQAGGQAQIRFKESAAWMPVSKVPLGNGRFGVFPHLLDRYKPGIIGVTRRGLRFCNESESYHDVGAAMIEACADEHETAMWLLCDQATLSKYGIGYAKPAPMPVGRLIRNGYLIKGGTLAELARNAGIDAGGLERTVAEYNAGAVHGEDRQFGRGRSTFNRYLADPEHRPNPCVAPIGKGPYYAVKLVMGDLGTFDGLNTSVAGEVLDEAGHPIPGLYSVGNDRASIMGGNYPGAGITLGPIMTFAYLTARHIAGARQAAPVPQQSAAAHTNHEEHRHAA